MPRQRRQMNTDRIERPNQITMSKTTDLANADDPQSLLADAELDGSASLHVPWEQIENGRYMPRRIRGSFRGGVLG